LSGVTALGVDEHVWRPGKFGAGREVACMVDLTRDQNGEVGVRLLDLVLGRSGPAYSTWLDARPEPFRVGINHAALDPFRGFANAVRATTCPTSCRCWTPSTSSSSGPAEFRYTVRHAAETVRLRTGTGLGGGAHR